MHRNEIQWVLTHLCELSSLLWHDRMPATDIPLLLHDRCESCFGPVA